MMAVENPKNPYSIKNWTVLSPSAAAVSCIPSIAQSRNPEINIFNPPQGTKILEFRVKDLDRPSNNHGGGKIEFNGEKVIKAGSFKYYRPCPPSSEVHTYRWTVTAYDKDNKKLGKTSFKKKYPVK